MTLGLLVVLFTLLNTFLLIGLLTRRTWRSGVLVLYIAGGCGLFVWLAMEAQHAPYLLGDVEFTRALQAWRSPWLDIAMIFIGLPGTPPQTLVLNALFVLIVLLCRMRAAALTLAIFIPTFGTLGTWVRCGINRARPSDDLVAWIGELKDRTCSFPSGHTVNFVIVLGFLLFIGLTQLKPSWHRNVLLGLYALYIGLMGLSRIYVGDHWASDVIGGYLLGSLFLAAMIVFYRWVAARFFNRRSVPTTILPKSSEL